MKLKSLATLVARHGPGKRVENRTLESGKFYTLIALGDGKQETLLIQDELR